MTDPHSELERYRQRRRTAGSRALLVLVVGIGVQVGGRVIASGHPAIAATAILAAMMATIVAFCVLLPVPPEGLLWPWQRGARHRRATARARRTSRDDGLDRLAVVGIFVALLPWQIFNSWLESQTSDLTTVLLVTSAVALSVIVVPYGVLELRRRLDRAPTPAPQRAAHPAPRGVVVLQRRADREPGPGPT